MLKGLVFYKGYQYSVPYDGGGSPYVEPSKPSPLGNRN